MSHSHQTAPGWIERQTWEEIQDLVPITCVDFVPVLRSGKGHITHVGLIRRGSPFGQDKWCHLGGRINRLETAEGAIRRHLNDSLVSPSIVVPNNPQPTSVEQWFPDERPGFGFDPRKHAVGLNFVLECTATTDLEVRIGGEAREFRWVPVADVSRLDDLWPGTAGLVAKLLSADGGPARFALTYQTLSARALAHNGLIWQTPGLAMTAQAFLLTIALSPAMSLFGRIASCLTSVVISLLCIQLMAKHSRLEVTATKQLEAMDRDNGLQHINAIMDKTEWHWYEQMRSRILWPVGFWIVLAVSLTTLGAAIWFPDVLIVP
ncbi:DUF4916 domain-containing protein [Pseudarthrobacter sp. NIBRBAC000502772]|uniref:DUF4916 domain-containing protein n=1 Tax=Pseudarthrobacter sp. NIBRBAC000502772 TaxID=2590775 RepID=UPI0011308BF1|nr:DUF4916 domain-containing protein [Pseudarthrobacter sp. NIBRBAC000502772]QDG68076.1 DUF4916 domain-containing protein [Pseudarthrobacter sp. NIBRBAC000502772]